MVISELTRNYRMNLLAFTSNGAQRLMLVKEREQVS